MIVTILAELESKLDEGMGYVTYVFRNLEENSWKTKYKMVTRCPNWSHRTINVGEVGFLSYEDHIAGEDKWFDGLNFNFYRYTMSQFIKFIEKPKEQQKDYIM